MIYYMKLLRRLLCALLTFTLVLPSAAFAENTIRTAELFDEDNRDNIVIPTDDEVDFLNYLISEFKQYHIDIQIPEKYKITTERFEDLYEGCFSNMLQNDYPDIFYFPKTIQYEIDRDSNMITAIRIEPSMTNDEIIVAQAAISNELSNIKSILSDDMSDLEKVLLVHDYIAAGYEYDTRVFENSQLANRTLDKMIIEKKGVCQGYVSLFKYVMDNIGIECEAVPSDIHNHIWNKVKISVDDTGEKDWYNIDVTADDPIMDLASSISHTFFLVNDEEIKELDQSEHSSWNEYKWDNKTPATVSDSTKFSGSQIHNVGSQIVAKDGKLYGFITTDGDDCNALSVIDVNNNTVTPYYMGSATSPSPQKSGEFRWFFHSYDNMFYPNTSSSIVLFNGDIYFNSPSKVYKYFPNTNTASVFYDFEKENPSKIDISHTYIYGLRVRGDKMYIEYTTRPYTMLDENETLISAKMDDIIEIAKIENPFPCSASFQKDDEGSLIANCLIPAEHAASAVILVPQYSGSVFIGFAETELVNNSSGAMALKLTCGTDCDMARILIWNKETHKPLSQISSYDFKKNENTETE